MGIQTGPRFRKDIKTQDSVTLEFLCIRARLRKSGAAGEKSGTINLGNRKVRPGGRDEKSYLFYRIVLRIK